MRNRTLIDRIDWFLLAAVLVLCCLGFLNLYSATYAVSGNSLLKNQMIATGIGLGFLILLLVVNYSFLNRFAYLIYAVAVFGLLLVLFSGRIVQGSRRWLSLGFVTFQVSDLMKFAIIIVLAKWYCTSKVIGEYSLKQLFIPFLLIMVPFALILKQPDLGTALLLLFIAFSIILFGKLRAGSIVILIVAGLTVIPLTWKFVLKDYQKKRIVAFVDPMSSPRGAGYNIIQSMIAVGSGRVLGKGYKRGTQTSLHFLPEHHTDFIFSAWAEEHGFLGSFFLLFIYFFILMRILRIAGLAKNRFGLLLVVGGGAIFFWYYAINITMVIGMLPVVGIPLPFFSYGGTAMVVNFMILGVIMNVYARRFVY